MAKIKELNINGTVYAMYQIEESRIYLKIVQPLFKRDYLKNENLTISIIELVENVSIKQAGFLNI
ncbi:MAG: hypothetical protein ABIN74_01290 [Ferruginibacter sp.]